MLKSIEIPLITSILITSSFWCFPAVSDSENEYGDAELTRQTHETTGFGRFSGAPTGLHRSVSDTGANDSSMMSGAAGSRYVFKPTDYPEEVRPLMIQGEAFRLKNELPAALQCYEKALKIMPNCAPVRLRRGMTRLKQRDYRSALEDLNLLLSKDPKMVRALHGRARCFEQMGDKNKALEDLTTLVAIEPDHGQAHMRRAELLESMGKTHEAAMEKSKGVDLIADQRVASLSATGHYLDALKVVNEGLKLEPNDKFLMLQKGKLLSNMHKYKEAIVCLEKVGNKGSAESFFLRGQAYEGAGEIDKAISNYSLAINGAGRFSQKAQTGADAEKRIKLAEYYHDRARANIKIKHYIEAIDDCSVYLPFCPEADGFSLRGDAYVMSDKLTNALADYKSATRINPQLQHALLAGAHVAEKLSEHTTAIGFYTALIKMNPTLSDLYLSRAVQYQKLNRLADSEKDLDKCVQLQPDDSLGYESLGRVHASMRQYAKAVDDYTHAIKLEPDSALLLKKRASIYECLGNAQAAAADKKAAEQKKGQ